MNVECIKNRYFDNYCGFDKKTFRHEFLNPQKDSNHGGWSMQYDNGKKLYQIIKDAAPNCMLEIGTYYGYSGAYILEALEDSSQTKFYTMESLPQHIVEAEQVLSKVNDNYQIFWQTINGNRFFDEEGAAVPKHLEELKSLSQQLSSVNDKYSAMIDSNYRHQFFDKEIDCCFIDGDHGYKSVIGDLEYCLDRMPAEGLFLCHDWAIGSDVSRAVDDFTKQNPDFLTLLLDGFQFKQGLAMILKEK